MDRYIGTFADENGDRVETGLYAASDADAIAVFGFMAAASLCSWVLLEKEATLTVDTAVYTDFNNAARPVAGSNNRRVGRCLYAVQSPRQTMTFSIPACKSTVVSAG